MSDDNEFFDKIEWEGGVLDALDYGLRSDQFDLSDAVKADWDHLVELFKELGPKADEFYREYVER